MTTNVRPRIYHATSREAPHRSPTSWRTPVWAPHALPVIERAFELALLALLIGYLLFDRGFAWLHVPGTPVFVGEVALALGVLLLATTRVRLETVIRAGTPLIVLAVFIAWTVLRGMPDFDVYGLDVVRDLAISYYGIFAWLVAVLLIGRDERLWHWLDMYGRIGPWVVLWFGPALVLQDLFELRGPFVPDSQVSIFSHKIGSIAGHAMMVLLYLWLLQERPDAGARRRRAVLTTLIVAVLGMAAIVNRGAFVSVAAGIGVLWLLDRRDAGKMIARVIGIGLIALAVAFALDLRTSVFANEREVSAQQFVTNMMSVVDPAAGGDNLSGTADWRLRYWSRLIADVRTLQPWTGFGFGPNLRERYGEQDEEVPARDTHNSHIGIYARSGLIGLTLWVLVWWTWFGHMLRIRRDARNSGDATRVHLAGWLIAAIVAILVNAVFDPALEGPQVAIWTWTLFGAGAALTTGGHSTARGASSREQPVTGGARSLRRTMAARTSNAGAVR